MATSMHCGIDYIRATTREAWLAKEWADAFELVLGSYRGGGIKRINRSFLGYTGGLAGKVFLGTRSDGWMLQISGSDAHVWWNDFGPARGNVTRIDFQITAKLALPCAVYLPDLWRKVCNTRMGKGRASTARLFSEPQGTTGISIGSRASERYFRIYDKGREQGLVDVKDLLRWEVELKGSAAKVGAYLLESNPSLVDGVRNAVISYYESQGVTLPIKEPYEKLVIPNVTKSPSVFTKLKWLRDDVSPTVRTLVDSVGVEAVLQALFFGTDGFIRKEDLILQLSLLSEEDLCE